MSIISEFSNVDVVQNNLQDIVEPKTCNVQTVAQCPATDSGYIDSTFSQWPHHIADLHSTPLSSNANNGAPSNQSRIAPVQMDTSSQIMPLKSSILVQTEYSVKKTNSIMTQHPSVKKMGSANR